MRRQRVSTIFDKNSYLFNFSHFTGILNGLFVGVGNGSGTMLGGLLVSKTGIRVAYRLFAAFLALVMLLFLACQWRGENTDDKTSYRALPNKDEGDSNE